MLGINNCFKRISKEAISGKLVLLMLDFDGTISPIVPLPENAYLPKATKFLLKKISKKFPVAIVSGRPIGFIVKKVGLPKIAYTGSHGLEWSMGRDVEIKLFSARARSQLLKVKKDFQSIAKKYPRLIIEEKPYALTFHYKFIKGKQLGLFRSDLDKFINFVRRNGSLKIFWDKETVEVLPHIKWDKGRAANLIYKHFRKKFKESLIPIYIGDSATDEDAFLALKSGITIRVGKIKKSSAGYYLENQRQVNQFLKYITHL